MTTAAIPNPEHVSGPLSRVLDETLALVHEVEEHQPHHTPPVGVVPTAPELDAVAVAMAQYEPPRFTLRALAHEACMLDAVLTYTEGELTPELEVRLDALHAALVQKVDGVRDYITALDADADLVKAEEKRLAEIRAGIERRRDRFKQYVMAMMLRMDRPKLSGTYGKLWVQRSTPSVKVPDPAALPDEYKRTEIVISTDAKKLRETLAATEDRTLYREVVRTIKPIERIVEDDAAQCLVIYAQSPFSAADDEVARIPYARIVRTENLAGHELAEEPATVVYVEPVAWLEQGSHLRVG